MKTYITHNDKTIKTRVYYNLGSYRQPRGYYLSVQPVEITEHTTADGSPYKMEKIALYSGYLTLLFEVTRQSKKHDQDAENRAAILIPQILENNF
jgi:hypothetical protein